MARFASIAVASGALLVVLVTILAVGRGPDAPVQSNATSAPAPSPSSSQQAPAPMEEVSVCGETADLPTVAERRLVESFRLQFAPGPGLAAGTKDVTIGGNESLFRIETTFFQGRPLTSNPTGTYLLQSPTVRGVLGNGTEWLRHEMRPFLFPGTTYMRAGSQESFCTALSPATRIHFESLGWGDVYADVVIETIRQAGG